MINVEDHAAHCRMAREIIVIIIIVEHNNNNNNSNNNSNNNRNNNDRLCERSIDGDNRPVHDTIF